MLTVIISPITQSLPCVLNCALQQEGHYAFASDRISLTSCGPEPFGANNC